MSVTLATIADALIEFILSLLRDPEAAAEFASLAEAVREAGRVDRPADPVLAISTNGGGRRGHLRVLPPVDG